MSWLSSRQLDRVMILSSPPPNQVIPVLSASLFLRVDSRRLWTCPPIHGWWIGIPNCLKTKQRSLATQPHCWWYTTTCTSVVIVVNCYQSVSIVALNSFQEKLFKSIFYLIMLFVVVCTSSWSSSHSSTYLTKGEETFDDVETKLHLCAGFYPVYDILIIYQQGVMVWYHSNTIQYSSCASLSLRQTQHPAQESSTTIYCICMCPHTTHVNSMHLCLEYFVHCLVPLLQLPCT